MTKTQIDKWFALSDRVDLLISRNKIAQADAPTLLTPIRQIADLTAGRELDISEREISRTEKSGFLVGSEASLAAHHAKERADLYFASRSNR